LGNGVDGFGYGDGLGDGDDFGDEDGFGERYRVLEREMDLREGDGWGGKMVGGLEKGWGARWVEEVENSWGLVGEEDGMEMGWG